MNRSLRILKDCVRRNRTGLLMYFTAMLVCLAVFLLYGLSMDALLYAFILSMFIGIVLFIAEYTVMKNRADQLENIIRSGMTQWDAVPEALTAEEADYQTMVESLIRRTAQLESEFDEERTDMVDYYTAWVHQIKTPVAVMKMHLTEDDEETRILLSELFRIEQYVDMVLQYIRLNSDSNDLVIKEYDLDELIRSCIRKYASQFIMRKLKVEFIPTGRKVVTDSKWFSLIIEQILSNAVKYTPAGTITICCDADGRLQISDTGIGIAAEDLPRIFEKGYTGQNGRMGRKSSGLGLYLSKKAADMLQVRIQAESEVQKGTAFTVIFDQREILND